VFVVAQLLHSSTTRVGVLIGTIEVNMLALLRQAFILPKAPLMTSNRASIKLGHMQHLSQHKLCCEGLFTSAALRLRVMQSTL